MDFLLFHRKVKRPKRIFEFWKQGKAFGNQSKSHKEKQSLEER